MSIKHIRIDCNSPYPPGIFVIRCNEKGRVTGENSSLSFRQEKHGAGHTDKVVKVVAEINEKRIQR